MAKCPHCERQLSRLKVVPVGLSMGTKDGVGLAYVCPMSSCGKIISVQMDPASPEAQRR